ncbi:MAG TPA: PDDEXK nuclease domain-containing protein [Chitinophagaceae bacterium]|nr:PDDEXK nuclease domain-containing protein [Chitinophagaceae bacterium]
MASEITNNYIEVLQSLKEKIRQSRLRAAHSVNKQLLLLYHEIGITILQQEKLGGWGAKIIDTLARDLKMEFPDMTGLSKRNLRYMKEFASAYPILQPVAAKLQDAENQKIEFVQPAVAQIPWTHHTLILDKLKAEKERLFYIQKAAENGWSKSVLVLQIESGLYQRQGKSINNFSNALPVYDSDLAGEMFKSPYIFDFLHLSEEAKEKELELGLIQHLKKFMLELGRGFAYVGNQFNLEVDGDDFFLDLLFYNTRLHCYVVFELKIGEFKPEYAGKLNFYLSTVDAQIKIPEDKPTIGILLCKTPNKTVVEYALRGIDKPMGVADFELKKYLPVELESDLPTVKELEEELEKEIQEFKVAQNPVDARLQAIKDKIKNLKTDEIQTPATFAALNQLYQTGLRVLYTELMEKVKVFDEDFYSKSFHWYCTNKNFSKLEQVDVFWKDEENLKGIYEFQFQIRLDGFKKAGTEHGNAYHTLTFRMDTYHYSFTLVNYNNQQPFLKKLYHQPLTVNDRQQIADVMMTAVMDDIERFLERIKHAKK